MPYLSLKNLAIDMVVRVVLPSLNSSTINMRWKPKELITRGSDLDTVTVTERDREINYITSVKSSGERDFLIVGSITFLIHICRIELIHP